MKLRPKSRAPALHTGKVYSFSAVHQHICSSPAAAALRRRGNDMGTAIKYLRKTTSGAAGIGLGAPGQFRRSWLCTQERLNPELVNIFGAAARYRRATVCSRHDDARSDNSALKTGKI
jgi:hypothetical protein